MPSPFQQPNRGNFINNPPTGFPLFFDKRKPRVVTADPWAFLRQVTVGALPKNREVIALSYIDQAFDFYEAAKNPHVGSKPLLYYYSFLNLLKATLLIRKVPIPVKTMHGITDPGVNFRKRLRVEGQRVQIPIAASDRSQLFPEFLKMLGADTDKIRNIRVVDLLAQIPSIHRTFTQATKNNPLIIPIKDIGVFRNRNQVWARIIFDKRDEDVKGTLQSVKSRRSFRRCLSQKVSENDQEDWFETKPEQGRQRGIDNALQKVAKQLRDLGASSILTSSGYRFYFVDIDPSKRLPPLAATYAAFFYLGSVTRYKPDVFDKILAGGYAWIVKELIATQPTQFLYILCSELAGVDVVPPYASAHH